MSEGSAQETVHTITREELENHSLYINQLLQDVRECSHLLPITADNLAKQVDDGLLLISLLNLISANAIDIRVVNLPSKFKSGLNVFQRSENLQLVVATATSLGISTVNCGVEDLRATATNHYILLGLIWQILRRLLSLKISLRECANLAVLMREGEDLETFTALSPEQILERWVNYHLDRVSAPMRVTKLGTDMAKLTPYLYLLSSLRGSSTLLPKFSALHSDEDKCKAIVDEARDLGSEYLVAPKHLTYTNPRVHFPVLAGLFNVCPALEDLGDKERAMVELMKEDPAESREERSYLNWLNSLGIFEEIRNLYKAGSDGLLLLKTLDHLENGSVTWKSVEKTPNNRFKRLSNCGLGVKVAKDALKLDFVNIGGVDIEEGNRKLVLSVWWQLMWYHIEKCLKSLQKDIGGGSEHISDSTIINWCNEKVKNAYGEDKVAPLAGFNDPTLASGRFLCYLAASLDPGVVDESYISAGRDIEERRLNALYAISIARKLGLAIFCVPEDIMEVKSRMIKIFCGLLMQCAYSRKK